MFPVPHFCEKPHRGKVQGFLMEGGRAGVGEGWTEATFGWRLVTEREDIVSPFMWDLWSKFKDERSFQFRGYKVRRHSNS